MRNFPQSVRPELVEGLFFTFGTGTEEVQCFDKLSTNGIFYA